jgi:hypothetical protein
MKKFKKISLADIKFYMSEVGNIEEDDRDHVLHIMEMIVSCINGRAHGGFVTGIVTGDLDKAKGQADMINAKYIKFYSDFVRSFEKTDPILIEALIIKNTVYLEEIKLQSEDIDAKVSSRWDVYISEVQKPFARLLMWKADDVTAHYRMTMIAPTTKAFRIDLQETEVMIPKK